MERWLLEETRRGLDDKERTTFANAKVKDLFDIWFERAQTQRAITAAKTKGPDKSIILVSTVRRNGTYPEVRIIQHPKNNCQDLTLIIEEVETTNCADIDRQSIQV